MTTMAGRIFSIEVHTKNRKKGIVTFDDGQSLQATLFSIQKAGFAVGDFLDDRQVAALRETDKAEKVRARAANILSYKNYSKAGLKKRLQEKDIAPDEAQDAVDWLSSLGYLDDSEFAQQMLQALLNKAYGARHIAYALAQKGVSREDIEALCLADIDYSSYIAAYITRKLGSKDMDKQQETKIAQALARRGHGWSDIRRALAGYGNTCMDEEYE